MCRRPPSFWTSADLCHVYFMKQEEKDESAANQRRPQRRDSGGMCICVAENTIFTRVNVRRFADSIRQQLRTAGCELAKRDLGTFIRRCNNFLWGPGMCCTLTKYLICLLQR